MPKPLLLLLLICPAWLYGQTFEYLSNDTLDEIVFDGKQYQNEHYFIFWKGKEHLNYRTYESSIYQFNNDLIPIDSILFTSYDDWELYPLKLFIENDTIYSFGTAINKTNEDNQILITKLTTDLSWINHRLLGTDTKKEALTDVIMSSDGKFIIAGLSFTNFYDTAPLAIKCDRNCLIEVFSVDTSFSSVKPTIVELSNSGKYHFVDTHQILTYDSSLNITDGFRPEFYNRFWFTFHLESFSGDTYFTTGNCLNYYEKQNNSLTVEDDEDFRDISFYLVDEQALPIDSGFISLPIYDDYAGGLYYSSSSSLIIGGVNNYYPGSPPFFEKDKRWIVVQNLDYPSKQENWFFEYGGDANYFMEGLYLNEDNGECIVFANRYDWMNTNQLDRDIFILKIDTLGQLVSSNGVADPFGDEFLIFPNPGTKEFRVKTDRNSATLYLFDMYGRMIIEQKLLSQESIIATSELEKGVYIYKIVDNSSSVQSSGIWIKQ